MAKHPVLQQKLERILELLGEARDAAPVAVPGSKWYADKSNLWRDIDHMYDNLEELLEELAVDNFNEKGSYV